jgi:hypothetical protein
MANPNPTSDDFLYMATVYAIGLPVAFLISATLVYFKKVKSESAVFLTLMWPFVLGLGVMFGIPIGALACVVIMLGKLASGLEWLFRQIPRLFGTEALPPEPPYESPGDRLMKRIREMEKEEEAHLLRVEREKRETLTTLQAKSKINTKGPGQLQ